MSIIVGAFDPNGRYVEPPDTEFADVQAGILYRQSRVPEGAVWKVVEKNYRLILDTNAGNTATWGQIVGTLSDQTDLQNALNALTTSVNTKVSKGGDTMTGPLVLSGDPTVPLHAATKQYVDAAVTASNVLTDAHIFVGSAGNVATDVAFTLNAVGGAFSLANTGVLTMPNADAATRGLLLAADWTTFNAKEPAIAAGTTAQYWRGDKTWQNFAEDAQDAVGAMVNATLTYVDATPALGINLSNGNIWLATQTFTPAPVFSAITATHVMYAGAAGIVSGSANLNWVNATSRLSINSSAVVAASLHVLNTTDKQLRLSYSDAFYTDLATNNAGDFLITPSGSRTVFGTTTNNSHTVNITGTSAPLKIWGTNGTIALNGGNEIVFTNTVTNTDNLIQLVGMNDTNSRNRIIFSGGINGYAIGWGKQAVDAPYFYYGSTGEGAATGFRYSATGDYAIDRQNNSANVTHFDIRQRVNSVAGGIGIWNSDLASSLRFWLDATGSSANAVISHGTTTALTFASTGAVTAGVNLLTVDEAFSATWNGSLQVPTKNAIYDKLITINNDVLFDHFTDANNGTTLETDLYSDTLAAAQLANNGEKIIAQYSGIFTGDATSTQQLKAYFGGTAIFDSGALGVGVGTTNWDLYITIIRVSSSVVRCSATLNTSFASLSAYAKYTEVTGLTLANTQIVKITGTAAGVSGGSNQITAKEGYVEFKPMA